MHAGLKELDTIIIDFSLVIISIAICKKYYMF